ncbi:hypothetical protein ALO95_200416 [Pseudomonas syringae pv. antirrhini]|uniref:Esterase n=1 Tax=Pseudomonas syringae pv. antirrhini TaxID=251702 RepID=A0A0P9L2H3_9PSED|nr:hypothetical protein ALO88_200023 [Pseudomonas syringae pv. antirrhini]RMP34260.1 hypothetical protein ALQ23_200392 [Pseudomonas syringae pv. antirrhini]RMW26146.1 hypothetical protein ALO95_200416 [Pseudomonas syringae pv. antirrhini]
MPMLRVGIPIWTLRVLLRRRASVTAFPRWSVRNDSRQGEHYRAHAPRGHTDLDAPRPLATQSVGNCIPMLEREER